MPDYQADSVLDTCQSFIDMGKENYLISTFSERIASLDLLPETKRFFSERKYKTCNRRDLSSLSKSDHRYQIAERKRNE
mgnify:CR=1 FL=1